jgi:trimeric autotransporter adhesin
LKQLSFASRIELMKHRNLIFTTILLVLAFLALSPAPNTFGVVPAPDGAYPNLNTAEGQNALKNLTTGSGNSGVGWYSLFSATTASFNTGVGAGALALNTADENTAVGTATLLLNNASGNTAVGSRALLNNSTGGALGNIQGIDIGPNVAVGQQALESNTIASANTAVGYQALHSFTTGPTDFEQFGLCTAVGFQALANATGPGFANSAFGYQSLMNSTSGSGNTATGQRALFSNTTGASNTGNGAQALYFNTTGESNTANGINALVDNTSGSDNTAVGRSALAANTTGNNNTALGTFAGGGVTTADNVIAIGHVGFNVSNSCFIGNIRGVTTAATDAIPVVIDSVGQLGTMSSSRRFKKEIKPMDKASEAILALKPVTFHYNRDTTGRAQFGLIAEAVAEVNPDLVARDKNGEIYTVRYEQINAMLLNEFLKEHQRVEHQQAMIAQLSKQVETLVAHVKEQDSKIRKVGAQVEVRKPVPRFAGISN